MGFDPITGQYDDMIKVRGDRTEYKRNARRYVRIAFESLKKYLDKDNRKFPKKHMKDVRKFSQDIVDCLDNEKEEDAVESIDEALKAFADWAVSSYKKRS